MRLVVKIKNNVKLDAFILREINKHFNETLKKSKGIIETSVRKAVIDAIFARPEFEELIGAGKLVAHFGLGEGGTPKSTDKLAKILEVWSQDLHIHIDKNVLTIEMIQADFKNVMSLPEAQQITEKGVTLDWLNWLLIQGDKTIIQEYKIKAHTNKDGGSYSRTGLAIMIKAQGGSWNVPEEFAGTVNSNFVTKAIDDVLESGAIDVILLETLAQYW